jgi:predicted dehydrogenase
MKVLIAGTGNMAKEYAKVIGQGVGSQFSVVGRSLEKSSTFSSIQGFHSAHTFAQLPEIGTFDFAVVTTSIESLYEVSKGLISQGIQKLLIEKPVSVQLPRIAELAKLGNEKNITVRVATNRRFYNSVSQLKSILAKEKPVMATFDFTEWIDTFPLSWQTQESGKFLALSNSIHVFDSVEFLLGTYQKIHHFVSGKGLIPWHSSAAHFSGLGICGECPVTHATSWTSPGRWCIEVMTSAGRYRLSPMEKLQVLRPQTVVWQELPLQDTDDTDYKPGLKKMINRFHSLSKENKSELPTLEEYLSTASSFSSLVGYAS